MGRFIFPPPNEWSRTINSTCQCAMHHFKIKELAGIRYHDRGRGWQKKFLILINLSGDYGAFFVAASRMCLIISSVLCDFQTKHHNLPGCPVLLSLSLPMCHVVYEESDHLSWLIILATTLDLKSNPPHTVAPSCYAAYTVWDSRKIKRNWENRSGWEAMSCHCWI